MIHLTKKIPRRHSTILPPLYLMIPHSQVDHLRLQSDTIYVQTIQIIQGILGLVQACWINWIWLMYRVGYSLQANSTDTVGPVLNGHPREKSIVSF